MILLDFNEEQVSLYSARLPSILQDLYCICFAACTVLCMCFLHRQCKAAYQSLLIADQHCRTRKYLLCVAGGVPCVSQMWVRDCCQEKKLLNYRNYLLPAGLGPEGHIVEW